MNERIDQLWGQALDAAVPETYSRLSYSQVLKVKQVFAELIVQECCSVVKPSTEYPTESVDIVEEFHRGYWVGCNDSTMRIEDHFGVEE